MLLTFLQECEDSAGIHRNSLEWDRNPLEWDWNPQESTGIHRTETGFHRNYYIPAGIELESAGMEYIEWNCLYIYICLYLLNSLCIYKCNICIYWSAYNYNLVPFNIKTQMGSRRIAMCFEPFFPMSLLCHFAIPIHSSNLYLNIS